MHLDGFVELVDERQQVFQGSVGRQAVKLPFDADRSHACRLLRT